MLVKLLIQIFLLSLRKGVPPWWYRSLKLFFILNLQPNISTFYVHHVTPYRLNELFHSALPWEYDAYVPPTRHTVLVSSTRRYNVFIYTITHSHSSDSPTRILLVYGYHLAIRSISSMSHKRVYILSSSQLCATLFEYIPLVSFLRTKKLDIR